MSRGFLAVFRFELAAGWRLPAAIAAFAVTSGLALSAGRVQIREDGMLVPLFLLFATLPAYLGARRILAEAEAPGFLSSRPVSRLAALEAKAAATALDLAVVGGASIVLGRGVLGALPFFLRQDASLVPDHAGLFLLGYIAFGVIPFACACIVRSRWIAGALAGAGLFVESLLIFGSLSSRWPILGPPWSVALIAIVAAIHAGMAVARGRADLEGTS